MPHQVTLEQMKMARNEEQTNLTHAQKWMATAMNHSCRSEAYNVSDEVVLFTKNIKKYCPHLRSKIKAWWVGPFNITLKVSQ